MSRVSGGPPERLAEVQKADIAKWGAMPVSGTKRRSLCQSTQCELGVWRAGQRTELTLTGEID